MPKERVIQVKGAKEAWLAVAHSDPVQEQEEGLSYKEKLLLRFRELMRGHFEKLSRWQAILDTERQEVDQDKRKLEVFATPNGLRIARPGEASNPKDRILEMQQTIQHDYDSITDYTI